MPPIHYAQDTVGKAISRHKIIHKPGEKTTSRAVRKEWPTSHVAISRLSAPRRLVPLESLSEILVHLGPAGLEELYRSLLSFYSGLMIPSHTISQGDGVERCRILFI